MAQTSLTQQNSLLPIFRLPPEILADIFTHGARDYHENTTVSTFRVPHWVNVTLVCRTWRAVALNYPALWTYHFTVSLRWTEELLVRSKQAPLKIRICCDPLRTGSWWIALLRKLLEHVGRMQEFCITMQAASLQAMLSLASGSQIQDVLTPAITYGDGPLRTLALTNCPLRWNSFDLRGVTALYLRHIPALFRLDIGEFLNMLNGMEALTVLHVENALPNADDTLSSEALDGFPKIGLPHLDRLLFSSSLSTTVALLSCVNIPLKTQVELQVVVCDSSSVEDYARFPSVLAQRFNQAEDLPSPTIRSLVLDHSLYESITFSASEHSDWVPHNLSMKKPTPDSNIRFKIHLEMFEDPSLVGWDSLISNICCSIPSTHVESFHVINPPFSAAFWRQTLGRLDGLRYMKLSDGFMPDLAPVLAFPLHAAEVPSGHGSAPHHMFAPALEELECHRINFAPDDDVGIISQESLNLSLLSRGVRRPGVSMIDCDVGEDEDGDMDADYGLF